MGYGYRYLQVKKDLEVIQRYLVIKAKLYAIFSSTFRITVHFSYNHATEILKELKSFTYKFCKSLAQRSTRLCAWEF